MIDVVVPAVREGPVGRLLDALEREWGPGLGRALVVWDGPRPVPELADGRRLPVTVLEGARTGPAAARNAGWRASQAEWVAFLDDDVVPDPGWGLALAIDVAGAADDVAAVAGHVRVPRPSGRALTDWERNVARLEDARFITADVACRRAALEAIGGFDERFPRAFREDTDLELRLHSGGWATERGERGLAHPVRPADPFVSVRLQRGNADDVLLWALHGRASGVGVRAKLAYAAITLTAAAGVVAALRGQRRAAAAGLLAWTVATARFAWLRIAPGPRSPQEVARMITTSAAIPPAAARHTIEGLIRHRREIFQRFVQHT